MTRKLAYLMSRFPHLSETFILREMSELARQGWEIALYPLIYQHQDVVHQETQAWLPEAKNIPYLSGAIARANGLCFLKKPLAYLGLLAKALWENRTSPKFLARVLALWSKAVYMAQLMQQEGIGHIHAHYATHPAFVAWVIHHLTGISYSVTVHAHDIFVQSEMLATKLQGAKFIVAISEYNRDYLARTVGPWARDKTHVVHCGIIPETYKKCSLPPSKPPKFNLITIGSLQPYKGQAHLIEACAKLRDQNLPVHCRIIGGGPEEETLKQLISHHQLAGIVELLGAQPQEVIADLLPTADCYVQPSIITPTGKMEGIPVSLMEALACALPVVASNISGIPELVQPGKTGYLVPPADASALADTLTQVYEDLAAAQQMGESGQILVQQAFSLSANVKALGNLFDQTLPPNPISLSPTILPIPR